MISAETELSDDDFLRAFAACELESLPHRDHIRLAWLVLKEQPLLSALDTLRRGFSSFAESKGAPMHYHETITWAFTLLIHERIERGRGGRSWQEFEALNPDLSEGKTVLESYYDPATLGSDLARRTFVLPERAIA